MLGPNNPVQLITKIVFFAEKPQNLPSSEFMVAITACAALLAALFLEVSLEGTRAFERAALLIFIYGIAIWLLLRIRKRQGRWKQTISARYGTTAVIQFFSFSPQWFIKTTTETLTEEAVYWLAVSAVPFGIWNLFVTAFVLKEALEITSRVRAFLLALGMIFLVSIIVLQLYVMLFGSLMDTPV